MIRNRTLGKFLIICVGLLFASVASAECVRYQRPPPGAPIDLDGPGSWGELQDTVTLDCLKYVGSTMKQGRENVLIRDERGKVHQLQVGSFMGENTGRIVEIDATVIYLLQIVQRNDGWEELVVKFPKR
jgi:type IV pilus assembly protein PilP